MIYFYDTSSLLTELQLAFTNHFLISDITLNELEKIKTSANKDAEIKYQARKLIHLLDENEDKYTILNYQKEWDKQIEKSSILFDNNDSKIILTALNYKKEYPDLVFITEDICCKYIAKTLGLSVQYLSLDENNYCGYKELMYNSIEELDDIYENIFNNKNIWNLLTNEYLIIINAETKDVIDKYKYTTQGFEKVNFKTFESRMFGKIKPKDIYQILTVDSLSTNKITMIRGNAGTGKSYLGLGYLFSQLEEGNIDKIIIFCNTVATTGSAKLGFYPGSRLEKLLDSQIGNFLSSKLKCGTSAEKLIAEGKLELLPMSDIRGYDTSGLNAGVYITEAQNLDIELMKLALQRIGEDSICILEGDSDAQVDLPIYAGRNNGMRRVSEVFRGDSLYGEATLKNIYRSHIAQLAESL